MAPLFLEPLLAYLLYYIVLGCLSLYHRRDRLKLDSLNKKLRKMVTELKVGPSDLILPESCRSAWRGQRLDAEIVLLCQDSTHYEQTLKLLEKFDPDYVPPTPRKQQQPLMRMGPGTPRQLADPQGRVGALRMFSQLVQLPDWVLGPTFQAHVTRQKTQHSSELVHVRREESWWHTGGAVWDRCST